MVFGLLPGLAHLLVLDRAGTGTVLFLLFVLGADAAVAGTFLLPSESAPEVYMAGCIVAGLAWTVSWLDMARLAIFRDYEGRAERRAKWEAEGVRLYAGGQIQKASEAFRECLSLDPRDPDLLFWFGAIQVRLGRPRRAQRAFRRCLHYDQDRKWAFEIAEQERRLREPRDLEVSATGSFRELASGIDTGNFRVGSGAPSDPGGAP
jgi:tetratricopeptide (TPR) repeat protein